MYVKPVIGYQFAKRIRMNFVCLYDILRILAIVSIEFNFFVTKSFENNF